jgi:serine/threonine-protein kinase
MQPAQIGPYKIVSRLGRGGMGAVYEATDPGGAPVAVKVLAAHLADDPGLRRRFNAEIDTLKSLRHPGIVQLLAFGEDDGQPYFAMELVRGESLEHILRGGHRFTWQETVAVALTVARALKIAHDHGIVHRDLKPANLLVAAPPEGDISDRVKLADFGIAKLFGGGAHTAHGNIVGTAEYMAPEQAAGKPVDHRVDVYALGLVMFAMLTGRPPFLGKQVAEVIEKQRSEKPPRVSKTVTEIPPALDELIDRMLMKDPAARPANALALGRLLSAIDTLHAASPVTPPTADAATTPALRGVATAHDRRSQATRATAETTPPDASPGIDHYAPTEAGTPTPDTVALTGGAPATGPEENPTRPFTGKLPHETTKHVLPESASAEGSRGATASTVVDRTTRNRFTTVEELDQAARAQVERDRAAQRRWQIVSAVVTLATIVVGGYLLLRPRSADELYGDIQAIAAEARGSEGDLRDARRPINLFLERFGDDPRAAEVKAIARSLDLDALEKRARRRPLGGRPLAPIERDYRAAMDREQQSPWACREALQAILAIHPDAKSDEESLWLELVKRQIDRLAPLAAKEQAEDAGRIAVLLTEADELATTAAAATDPRQRDALAAKRLTLLEGIVELYSSRPHAAAAVEIAKRQLEQ